MPVGVLILCLGGIVTIGAVIIASKWLDHRQPLLATPPDDVRRLAETMESLQEQVQRLSGQMDALDERMDFTERLLSPPREKDSRTE